MYNYLYNLFILSTNHNITYNYVSSFGHLINLIYIGFETITVNILLILYMIIYEKVFNGTF